MQLQSVSLFRACRYAPPCCKIKHTDMYRCAHEWNPDTGVPFGDPMSGGVWKRDWPDHGSYEGGTSFGDPVTGWVKGVHP